jgi:hypothetical protein
MRSPDEVPADEAEAPDDVALCAEDVEGEDVDGDDVEADGVDDDPPHAARPSATAAASRGAETHQRTL